LLVFIKQLLGIWPIPVAARSRAWVWGSSPAEIAGSNPAGGMVVSCECCGLPGRGLCVRLITRPEKTYRVWILGLTLVNVTVGQMVEALRYKLEGRGFDSRWCHGKFSLTQSFRPHNGPGFDSASNRNEYQEYFLGVKAAGTWGWPPYCANYLEIREPQPPGIVSACPGL